MMSSGYNKAVAYYYQQSCPMTSIFTKGERQTMISLGSFTKVNTVIDNIKMSQEEVSPKSYKTSNYGYSKAACPQSFLIIMAC